MDKDTGGSRIYQTGKSIPNGGEENLLGGTFFLKIAQEWGEGGYWTEQEAVVGVGGSGWDWGGGG